MMRRVTAGDRVRVRKAAKEESSVRAEESSGEIAEGAASLREDQFALGIC
jgi:hypothetical protein